MCHQCLYRIFIRFTAFMLFLSVIPTISVVMAVPGTISLSSSSSTSSGDLIVGPNKSVLPAFGPLTLGFKSDLNAWTPGLVIREVTGNIGIGTITPSSKLDVNGVIEAASLVDTANPAYYLDPANVTESLVVAGNVGIGKTNPSGKLDVTGNIILGDNSGSVTVNGTNISITSAGALMLSDDLTLSTSVNKGITGGGLTDCAGSTSKLLWSASTKQFSCGLDNTGDTSMTLVEKNADETVNNSSTLQNDDDLKFTMAANTAYAIEMIMYYNSTSAAPDFKYAFTIPAGASMNLQGQGFTSTTTMASCRINVSGSTCTLVGSVAPDWTVSVIGIVQTAATPGDFQLQWAQNSANSANTVVNKNSWMKVNTLTGAADLAEIYGTDDPSLMAGNVVSIASRGNAWVTKSAVPYDPKAIGVVSTKPSSIMGSAPSGAIPVAVALTGRVPIRIDPRSAPITPGDFLTSSRTPGLAEKATTAGYALAKALDYWQPETGQQTVVAILSSGFVDPNLSLTNSGLLQVNSLSIGDTNVAETLKSQEQRISNLEEQLTKLQRIIDRLQQ